MNNRCIQMNNYSVPTNDDYPLNLLENVSFFSGTFEVIPGYCKVFTGRANGQSVIRNIRTVICLSIEPRTDFRSETSKWLNPMELSSMV